MFLTLAIVVTLLMLAYTFFVRAKDLPETAASAAVPTSGRT